MPRTAAYFAYFISLLIAGCAFMHSAHAQESYPTKPVRIVIGNPPGGSIDLMTRVLADRLAALLKTPFLVENRPGANELVGLNAVTQAEPNGYTLFVGSNGLTALPVLLKAASGRDILKELAPIGNVLVTRVVFLARLETPYNNMDELLAHMKQNPGKVNYAGGAGFTALQSAWFRATTKADFLYVAYGSASHAYQAVAAGQADMMLQILGPAVAASNSGKAKLLAITGNKRNELLPTLPNLNESQNPELKKLSGTPFGSSWIGLFAPAGTPGSVISTLAKAKADAVRDPELISRLRSFQGELVTDTPEGFAKTIMAEAATYKEVAAQLGLKPE